jgi:N-methylhydantoinase A/oxoprolinase/acetone carboxylase beta subunit
MPFHIGIDVGGTFTDLFAIDDRTGRIITEKADTSPDVLRGVIDVLTQGRIAARAVRTFVFGATIATNALVEGKTAPVAFIGSKGFTDVLEIRRTWRQHLFGWQWLRPPPLVPHELRFGVGGRINWKGEEIEPLDLTGIDRIIDTVRRRGIDCVAVSFLFSFMNPSHEHSVRQRFRELAPEIEVTISSDVNPEIKEYERASTTVIAASLKPLVDKMLGQLEAGLVAEGITSPVQVIKSNGGIMSAGSARAKPLEMVRSGPAGGVASAVRLSRDLGLPNLITLDIGGTTADVAVISNGEATYTQQTDVAWDVPIRLAMADVRSVGAGGGSIASLDAAGRLRVGPESAGSRPGPVSYGRGGTQPTVTDAAVVTGVIEPRRFLGGRMPLDAGAAAVAIERNIAHPLGMSVTEAASGIIRLAGMRMAQLISEMTVQVGLDPRDYVLVAFGGAGPLFAATLAQELGCKTTLIPVFPAVWSALGGLMADIVHDYARSHMVQLQELDMEKLNAAAEELVRLSMRDLARDAVANHTIEHQFAMDIRYQGQSHEITVPLRGGVPFGTASVVEAGRQFDELHERTYAHRRDDPHQLVTLRLVSRVKRHLEVGQPVASPATDEPVARTRPIYLHGVRDAIDAKIYERDRMPPRFSIEGPAIIEEAQSATLVLPDTMLEVGRDGELMIRRLS